MNGLQLDVLKFPPNLSLGSNKKNRQVEFSENSLLSWIRALKSENARFLYSIL